MEGPLEEAWAVAKAAKDLRCALEGGGSGGCLHHLGGTAAGWIFFRGGGALKKTGWKKRIQNILV